ncbi:MAG TPA: dienelactone hydrolase family protein [Magnetospirillaceae bacterium]|jgi:carboxymethylenebutenolidase
MTVQFDRRRLLQGLAGLPLATILADPELARAAASATESVTITTPNGRKVSGALAKPAATPAPVIILVHEWWGLNDQIKAVAVDFAAQGYTALALDLMGVPAATTPDEASKLVANVKPEEATETAAAWIDWGRKTKDGNGKLGIIGWCFGGGYALLGSIARPVDATVIYYGKCDLPAEQLAKLKGPVLGHFGTQDPRMNHEMVGKFEAAMKQDGKTETVYWYDAPHAFANPTGANYHKAETQLAWSRTLDFFNKNLKG